MEGSLRFNTESRALQIEVCFTFAPAIGSFITDQNGSKQSYRTSSLPIP
ncbi:hypothetical protein TRICHSKD4_0372 [Roseibium sp. TrichSKD4]|nr:hypothetical protein TRICHSKD4_0372 [Roseibium sp. TrichSKD4]